MKPTMSSMLLLALAWVTLSVSGCATGTIVHQAFEKEREYVRTYGRARICDDQFMFSYQTGDALHRRNYRASFPWKGHETESEVEPPYDVRRGRVWPFSGGSAVPVKVYTLPPRCAVPDAEQIVELYDSDPTMVTLWSQSGQMRDGKMIDVYSTNPWRTFYIVTGPPDAPHAERMITVRLPPTGTYHPWWRVAGHGILLPIAVVVDVVTLPVQIPMAIVLYRGLSTIDK